MKQSVRTIAVIGISFFCYVSNSFALPFNDDMVNIQIKAGQFARPAVEGTVPRGSLAAHIENKQEAELLVNSRKDYPFTVEHGKRLFKVNCAPCHGDISSQQPYGPAVNAPGKADSLRFMTPPDITSEFYYSGRSDGYIYATIHFGGLAMMPALGWKFSPEEHWDIVNYVRSVQKKKLGK